MTKIHLDGAGTLDLARLIDSRLLIQGTSGSGKSHVARLILERAHPHVQCIVIDPEGEYPTLRERFPFLLFGPGGEVRNLSPRSAPVVARTALEVGKSVVVDLSEMKGRDHVDFVTAFAAGLLDAPKEFRHPTLVVLEEAQLFAPEGGDKDAALAISDLSRRGRKKGLCLVVVTQRISDVKKSVVAQCGNRLIGLTTLDTDVNRAASELGLEDKQRLRVLERGEFLAYGPAFPFRDVRLLAFGDTETHAPRLTQGGGSKPPPPTPEKLRSVLALLDQIPKEAAKEVADLAEAKARIRDLEREVRAKPVPVEQVTKVERVEVPRSVLSKRDAKALRRLAEAGAGLRGRLDALGTGVVGLREAVAAHEAAVKTLAGRVEPPAAPLAPPTPSAARATLLRPVRPAPVGSPRPQRAPAGAPADGLTATQQRILDVVAMLAVRGIPATRESVARWQRLHPTGSRYSTDLARLREGEYLSGFTLLPAGEAAARALPTGLDEAFSALEEGTKRTVLRAIVEAGRPVSRDELAAALGIHPTGSRYSTDLAWLRTMGLIPERGPIALTDGATR